MLKRLFVVLILVGIVAAQQLGVGIGGTGTANPAAHAFMLGEGTAAFGTAGPCGTNAPVIGQGGSADPACGNPTMPTAVGSIPTLVACGSTTTCGNTTLGATARLIFGACPFSAATTCTITGITAFTSSTSYFCVVTDSANTGNTFKVANVSSSSFTITAATSNSDSVNYQCAGN